MEPYLPTSAVRQPPDEPVNNGAAASSPSCVKRLTLELVESYLKTNPASKPVKAWQAAATAPRANGAKPKAPRRALTQPCEGVANDGADNAEAELVTYAGDVLGPGGEDAAELHVFPCLKDSNDGALTILVSAGVYLPVPSP